MILINSSPKDSLKIFQPFLPIHVPVGIGCLLSVVEREGIKPMFIDEQVEDNVLGLVAEYVKKMEKPYIFGFSVFTIAFKRAIHLSKELKRIYPDSVIIFGSIHPTAMPEEVLSYNHVDIVLKGEGEKSLIELYKCIKEGKDFTHIDNLSYRVNDKVVHNSISPGMENLDSLPSFPYHLFNPKKYDMGFILSSRGCPHRCIFCSNRVTTRKKYRYRSAEFIIDDIDLLFHKYNMRHIIFIDDNFLVSKERIWTLLEKIRENGYHQKITFEFQSRGDNVNHEILKELYDSGFKSIFFGVETASEEVMKIIKKGETVAQCTEAIKMAKEIGFHVSATFIYGLPGDTHKNRMDCIKLSEELGIDMVRYNNATPYPGTELYETARRENSLKVLGLYDNFLSVSTFIENPFKKIPFTYVPHGSTEADIRRDILFGYFKHYLNIRKLINIFAKPEQNVGWFNAGEKKLDILKKLPALFFLCLMLLVKFVQLFHYTVLKKETAISFNHFMKVFDGLWYRKKKSVQST